jgi:hypothetical protein
MNSLPFISHHLFVAAIGNEGHAHERLTHYERPARQEQPPFGMADSGSAIVLEVLAGREPLPSGASRPLRASVAQMWG